MLSEIRDKTQGIFATFILVMVIVPFALWGVNSYFDTGGQINVAKVGGVEISQNAYRNEIDRLRGRMEPKTLDNPQFKQTVLNNLIEQALIVQQAEDQGYCIGNAQLAEIIRHQPNFQRDGKFDPALYEVWLRREGMSAQQFEARVRENILITQVQTGISESLIITQADIANLARLLEQVRVEYLRLSAADLDPKQPPTEEELKKAYSEEAARYVVPEKRRASHILVSLPAEPTGDQAKEALAKIQDIAKQVRAGADFAGLAKKHSVDSVTAGQGGDLGEIRRGVLPKELEDALYALKSGEVSQPIRSTYGYQLVKLTAHTPEKRKSFADVRKELVEAVRRRQGEERFFDVSEKFRNLVYEQPDSLAPAAKALGLEIRKSEWFTHAGGTGIAAHPKVV